MAHQATNIPWQVLASNLKWSQAGQPGNGDLQLRYKPQQAKELRYFITAFIANVREHAKTARKKYPDTYEVPQPDSIILGEAAARKITPTIRRWGAQVPKNGLGGAWLFEPAAALSDGDLSRGTGSGTGISADTGAGAGTGDEYRHYTIPHEERTASAFSRKYLHNQCYYFFQENGKAFFNQEIVKTLLLHGEMDTVLRVCALPEVDLERWWDVAECQCQVSYIRKLLITHPLFELRASYQIQIKSPMNLTPLNQTLPQEL